ncbi:hypothetical protein NP493_403g09011 [Ridgeia piscesae]|uniref:TIR domain-containing protein n=1 Tax=Ridgeia piscesae TaxID=27915 RepID=A0AAD9NUP9_RIDPI|nr:hypothetical protein NP493_403g09011 [Ridgeia piscesae]
MANGEVVTDSGTRVDTSAVKEAMGRLKATTDYKTKECYDDLKVILETIRAEETPSSNGVYETTNVIINAGLADLFHKMLSATPEPEGFAIQNMRFVSACMCNATKRSSTFCENLVAKSIPREILKYLKTEKLDPEQHKELMGNENVRTCVINLMCILHNVMKKEKVQAITREGYKKASAPQVLNKFRSVENCTMKTLVIFILAYITTDEENEKINECDEHIRTIVNMLSEVCDPKKKSKHGFSAVGLLEGLIKLASNDANKVRLVRVEAVPIFTKLLEAEETQEQLLAAKILTLIAFRCRDFVIQEPGCVTALKAACKCDDNELEKKANGDKKELKKLKELKRNAKEALWNLNEPKLTVKDTKDDPRKHIMISYQWDSQELMMRIADGLEKAGFKIWMDVKDMSGSTLEAMAAAVENASMVIIGASTKYKDSVSCRTEGEYAYNKRRTIVPLIVEYGYTPDGWLGPIVMNTLYFEFTNESKFDEKLEALIHEIQRRGECMKQSLQCSEGACTRKTDSTSVVTEQPASGTATVGGGGSTYCSCCSIPRYNRVSPAEQVRASQFIVLAKLPIS